MRVRSITPTAFVLLCLVAGTALAQNPFLQKRGERRVTRIDFVGHEHTREYVLRRELGFGVGDAYDPELVTSAWERLEALPFVAYVEIQTDRPTPDSVELLIRVEEDTRFRWAPGLEYSRRHGHAWLTQVSVGSHSLTGRGDTLDLSLEGWRRSHAKLSYANPWILGRARLGVYAQTWVDAYEWQYGGLSDADHLEYGGALGLWRDLGPDLTMKVSAEWRRVRLDDLGAGDLSAFGTLPSLTGDEAEATDPAVEIALVHDSRDQRYYPNQGVHARLAHRFAGMGIDLHPYTVTTASASGFFRVPRFSIVAVHAGIRDAGDPMPYYERSYLGGPMDLRGVNFGSVRGDDAFRASIELRRPIAVLPLREGRTIGLGVHAFHDWGKAYENHASFDDAPIRYSYGLGVHFNLNTRNYRFEWAHTDDGDDVFVFEDSFHF